MQRLSLVGLVGLFGATVFCKGQQKIANYDEIVHRSEITHAAGVDTVDLSLIGEVTRVDTGAAGHIIVKGTVAGRSTLELRMPSATIRETSAITKAGRARTWNLSSTGAPAAEGSSQSSVAQASTTQNLTPQSDSRLFPAIGWFFPYISLRAASMASDRLIFSPSTQSGVDPKDIHIAMRWKNTSPNEDTYLLHAGTLPDSVTIDSESMLVKSALFMNVQHSKIKQTLWATQHPTFEERVDYSDYRRVQGVPVPMHIQVSINRTPIYDIHLNSVSINTGLTIATPED